MTAPIPVTFGAPPRALADPTAPEDLARKAYVDALGRVLIPTGTKTTAYTAAIGELVKADATAGPITITIPTPVATALVGVRKIDNTANAVTVTDGAGTSFNLRIPDESRILIGQSTAWFTSYGLQTMAGLDTRYSQIGDPVTAAQMPRVLSVVRTVNPSGGFIAINADTNGNSINSTLNGAAELSVPTGGTDTQLIQGFVLAATTTRVLTFATGLGRLAPVPATLTIPAGKVARYALRRTDITGAALWLVESAGIQQ